MGIFLVRRHPGDYKKELNVEKVKFHGVGPLTLGLVFSLLSRVLNLFSSMMCRDV